MNDPGSTDPVLQDAGPERHWFARLAQGVFEIQQCGACHRYVFYPRVLCPHCGGRDLVWVRPSGLGTIYSTTVIRNKPENGGDYNVSLIDLAEGLRMMGHVVGIPPESVRIGLQVKCTVQIKGEAPLLVWEVADAHQGEVR